MAVKKFSERMGDWVRNLLSCCDRFEGETTRPALQISGPTNFRRHDVTIGGLTEEQQTFIRTKAETDAKRLWEHLQPLQSSPSSEFAERPPTETLPTYEDFVTMRAAQSLTSMPSIGGGEPGSFATHPDSSSQHVGPHSSATSPVSLRSPAAYPPMMTTTTTTTTTTSQLPSRLDRVRAHGRKISGGFRNPLHPHSGGEARPRRESGNPYEMRSLIGPDVQHGRRSQGEGSEGGHSKEGSLSDSGKDMEVKL